MDVSFSLSLVSNMSIEGNGAIIGMHYFQPPRGGKHAEVVGLGTDPQRVNWTARVNRKVYRRHALQGRGVLEEVSFTLYPTLDLQLREIDPKTSDRMRAHFRRNGVSSPFVHGIMSADWAREDIEINVDAGNLYFLKHTGAKPNYAWTGEGTYDNTIVDVLADRQQGFICGPEEIYLDNGGSADNRPTVIRTPNGKQTIALPFDRDLSGIFAFDKKSKVEAPRFVEEHLRWRLLGNTILVWTDGETNGWWDMYGHIFLSNLVKRTDIAGRVMSVNDFDTSNPLTGTLKRERTAWSCPHPDVKRWRDACGCHDSGIDLRWKRPYYAAHTQLNEAITDIVKPAIGSNYQAIVTSRFEEGYLNPGIQSNGDAELSLSSAKVSSMLGRNSCATFFDNIYTSGLINLVFVRQAVLHLVDAGFTTEARRIEEQYIENMRLVDGDFREGRTGADVYLVTIGRSPMPTRLAA